MTRVDRIRHTGPTYRASRARNDSAPSAGVNLPVPVGPVVTVNPVMSAAPASGDSEFNAQLMGQDGQTRGLRGGGRLIETAHKVYNRIEWSGRRDRRARAGRAASEDA